MKLESHWRRGGRREKRWWRWLGKEEGGLDHAIFGQP
jgi:hypothetical protein